MAYTTAILAVTLTAIRSGLWCEWSYYFFALGRADRALLWLQLQPRVSRVLITGAHRFRETEALRCLFDFRGRLSKY